MYNNESNTDDIILRYCDTSSWEDTTMSFHTRKDIVTDVDLGDLLDFATPNAEVKTVDTLPNGEYNVVLKFENTNFMKHFVRMFASNDLSVRKAHMKKYKEQKENAVLS